MNLFAQVENVPLHNQVYEFLNRMNVKGLLPTYSNTILPISRKEVGEMLKELETKHEQLSDVDKKFLEKFQREFAYELGIEEQNAELFSGTSLKEKVNESFSDKEKYLYTFHDSNATMFVEFLGSFEYRMKKVTNAKSVSTQLFQYGGRIRGTYKHRLGYSMQATNGTQYDDKAFALEDQKLKTNYKLNEPNSHNFDFTEGYLRADLDWLNIQFGSEFQQIGTGYSDKLILSDNAPVFDALKIDAKYKSVKFLFVSGTLAKEAERNNYYNLERNLYKDISAKFFSLHRVEVSLSTFWNLSFSEIVIYQRLFPVFAYLNPVGFYKSVEHSLGDRDNAIIVFDTEIFPLNEYKLYGALFIDDINFSKIGTGWWGNELAWQGGIYRTDLLNLENLDAVIEYTRIEPFVYSHHIFGNSYSHKEQSLGHHLPPNSDEIFFQVNYRVSQKMRTWFSIANERHGENKKQIVGFIDNNVGGTILQGHRVFDPDKAKFLDGNLRKTNRLQFKATYEPITNYFIEGMYEFRQENLTWLSQKINSHYFSLQVKLEY